MSEWLDRGLIHNPYHYCLCLTEKDFHAKLKHMGLPKKEWPSFILNEHSQATIHTYTKDDKYVAIVCLNVEDGDKIQHLALLVHEAVHLWQYVKTYIGESQPSSEFEAYAIQSICQELFDSYTKEIKKWRKSRKPEYQLDNVYQV